MSDLVERMMHSPAVFREHLRIDVDGEGVLLRDVVDPWQAEDFAALDAAWLKLADPRAPDPAVRRAYLERPRGCSKTTDIAVSATWALTFSRGLNLFAVAADLDQSRILRDTIARLTVLNPTLSKVLRCDQNKVSNRQTGSVLTIMPGDVGSSYGIQADAILCDEVVHWPDHTGEELWHSLFSSSAKRRNCVLVVISNAGRGKGESWQWLIREAAREGEGWYFRSLAGARDASWITQDRLDEQKRMLPSQVYERLWENTWTSGAGDALTADEIDRSLSLAGPAAGPEFGWRYCGGLDLSTRRDFSGLCIIGKHCGGVRRVDDRGEKQPISRIQKILNDIGPMFEPDPDPDYWPLPTDPVPEREPEPQFEETKGTNKLRLVRIHCWRPEGGQVDLQAIERAVLQAHEKWGLSRLAVDVWQAEHMVQRLSKAGVPVEGITFTGSVLQQLASETLGVFRENRIALFDSELTNQLRDLVIVQKQYGYRLTSPRSRRGGHGDLATALCLALLAARDVTGCNIPLYEGDLAYLPG